MRVLLASFQDRRAVISRAKRISSIRLGGCISSNRQVAVYLFTLASRRKTPALILLLSVKPAAAERA